MIGDGSLSGRHIGIVVAMRTATAVLHTDRLVLTPLDSADASEMVEVLSDSELYAFTGGNPPSLEELESRYRSQVAGPPHGGEVWHNWILRLVKSRRAVGFVQATVIGEAADLAWVVGPEWQGRGIAVEAVAEMCEWLGARGIERFTAHIRPEHDVSGGVAAAVGLRPTEETDDEGEVVWASPDPTD